MKIESRIKDALHELATGAPDPTDAMLSGSLRQTIRRKRRIRHTGTTIVTVGTAVVVSGAVLAGVRSAAAPTGLQIGSCGQLVTGAARTDLPLRMTGEFPAEVPAGRRLEGTVTVTNQSGVRFEGIGPTHPDYTVVREGRVVTVPEGIRTRADSIELAPGSSKTFPAAINLRRCDGRISVPGVLDKTPVASPAGTPLAPGRYRVYASLTAAEIDDNGALMSMFDVQGGPWIIDIR